MAVLDAEDGAGDRQAEAAGAGAPGVKVKGALEVLDGGLVGVAVEDDGDSGGLGADVEGFAGVEHVDEAAG